MTVSTSDHAAGTDAPVSNIRPRVRVRGRDNSVWLFAGAASVVAILMFIVLSDRQAGIASKTREPSSTYAIRPETIPLLVLPEQQGGGPRYADPYVLRSQPDARRYEVASPPQFLPAPVRIVGARPQYSPPQLRGTIIPMSPNVPYPNAPLTEPTRETELRRLSPLGGESGSFTNRIGATRLERPDLTIPQGTLISAVLETAIDSTGPGQVRAMVTKDVRGFDGTRILIPRGSKLYGAYDAAIEQGQKRAQVRWSRLLRPDAVIINLDSPASDPLGRAGVKGRVNSHFFTRLGNALLSTTMGIGQALTARQPPIVISSSGQQTSTLAGQSSEQIRPTLSVRQGSRISIFVQHDLDFTAVELP